MATLQADLTLRLDARALVATHFGSGGAGGEIAGPLASLQAVTLPVDVDELTAVAGGASFDANGISTAVSGVLRDAGALAGTIPGTGDLLGPIERAVSLAETVTGGTIAAELTALVAQLRVELEALRDAGFASTLLRVQRLLGQLTGTGSIGALLAPITARIPPFAVTLAEVLPALDGLSRAMGGLMSLESVLAESERLSDIMARQIDAAALEREVAAVERALAAAAARIAALAPTASQAETDAASDDVRRLVLRIGELLDRLAMAMGSGEATLVYLDVDRVLAEVAAAMAMATGADLAPAGRVLARGVDAVRPYLPDLRGAPSFALNDFVVMIEARVAELAAAIDALDVTQPVQPIASAITTVTAPLASLEELLQQAIGTVRSALTSVSDAVAALPIEPIASAIRSVVAPVAAALDALAALLADVQAALEAIATQVTTTLGQVESALDEAKRQIEALFQDAKAFVESVNLPGVVDSVGGAIQSLAGELDKAQMQPYFDAAASAIDTAADVIGAVPFGMLPESMKAEVDEAVKPIKEADARAAAEEIKSVLQVSDDCTFAARQTLETAIADVKAQFDALIAAIRERGARAFLAELDAQLQEVAAQIRTLSPALTLEPVQGVVDDVKAAVAGIDVTQALAPLDDAFTAILAAVDEYSPERLVAPIAERVDDARTAVKSALRLEQWRPTIDDVAGRVTSLLDVVDPAALMAQLDRILRELQRQLAQGVDANAVGGVGTLVTLLLQGTGLRIHPRSFEPVAGWLRGDGEPASTALGTRATRIAESMRAARATVGTLDPMAIQRRLAPGIAAVRGASAARDAGLAGRARLQGTVAFLDFDDALARLDANRDRLAASLERSASTVETLQRTGFGQADDVVVRLRDALAPLGTFTSLARDFLQRMGIPGLDRGLAGAFEGVLAVVPPERLTAMLLPIVTAIRGRLVALADAIVDPIRDAVQNVEDIIDLIDLAPLTEGVREIVDEVKAHITSLSPASLLAEPLASLAALKAQVAAFDPVGAIAAVLTALQDAATRVLAKLSAAELLETPLQIYDDILNALSALDPNAMLAPIFDQLDEIARQVCTGLDRTVEAFEHLQESLPSGGGAGDVAGSIGVEIGF